MTIFRVSLGETLYESKMMLNEIYIGLKLLLPSISRIYTIDGLDYVTRSKVAKFNPRCLWVDSAKWSVQYYVRCRGDSLRFE